MPQDRCSSRKKKTLRDLIRRRIQIELLSLLEISKLFWSILSTSLKAITVCSQIEIRSEATLDVNNCLRAPTMIFIPKYSFIIIFVFWNMMLINNINFSNKTGLIIVFNFYYYYNNYYYNNIYIIHTYIYI